MPFYKSAIPPLEYSGGGQLSYLNEDINEGVKGQRRPAKLIRGVREEMGAEARARISPAERMGMIRASYHRAWRAARDQVEVNEVMKGSPKAKWVFLFILPHEIKWQQI